MSSTAVLRKFYKAHVYAGVFIALHFAVLALTGLPLLFRDEIEGVPEAAPIAGALPARIDAAKFEYAWRSFQKAFPRDRPLALFPDEQASGVGQFRMGIDGERKFRGARKIRFDVETGKELIASPTASGGIFDWLLRLHRELFLGSTGKIYVGFAGTVYVFMLLSGMVLYGKFSKGRRFGQLRAPSLSRMRDLHKFFGVVTFAWSLVVGISGVFLALNGVLLKLHQASALSELRDRYTARARVGEAEFASLEKIIGAAQTARPDSVITYLAFPDTEFSIPGHFLILANGTTTLTAKLSEMVVVESGSGKLVDVLELPWYLKLAMLSEPLHFGNYGGLPLKIGWAVFTLLSMTVAALGVSTFFRKRRRVPAESPPLLAPREPSYVTPYEKPYAKPYTKPLIIGVITVAGIVVALVTEGPLGRISSWIAWMPAVLALLAFGYRERGRDA